jgi:hypothetical protein
MALIKQLSEMILACSYFFIGGGCECLRFIQANQGLYNFGKECENIQEEKAIG